MGGERRGLAYRVARRIASKRRSLSLSQEVFASLLGIALKNVQRLESGKQNLSLATIERVADALQVVPEDLLTLDGDADPDARRLPRLLARLSAAGYPVRTPTERGRRPRRAVPVMTLSAAAGRLGGTSRVSDILGWVVLPGTQEPPEGRFVAEVRGRSMEPRIPDRSLCLFGPAAAGPLRGRVLLVAHHELGEGATFALKRIKGTRELRDGRTRVTLESVNPAFPPIVIDTSDDDDLRVVAEFVTLLA